MSAPRRSRGGHDRPRSDARRPMREDLPLWRQAMDGIGTVVVMSLAVSVLGIVLAWLAALVL